MPDGSVVSRGRMGRGDDGALAIGLVNAMPPAAMRSAEWQFRSLIEAAAGRRPVRFRYFALPGLSGPANDHVPPGHHYEDLDRLWDSGVEGLIVTGTEPREDAITDERCWPAMASLIDWACEHTISTIWSCFAAHAAVFRLDGIARRKLPRKVSGVFLCERNAVHWLLADAPAQWSVPHSRHNDLDESALRAAGYDILSRAAGLGADMFVRPGKSLFVMLQGHPEYGGDTLLREYRRDVMRYLTGQTEGYPEPPDHYFDPPTAAAMAALRERALLDRSLELLGAFDATLRNAPPPIWRGDSARLFARWLEYVAEKAWTRASQLARP